MSLPAAPLLSAAALFERLTLLRLWRAGVRGRWLTAARTPLHALVAPAPPLPPGAPRRPPLVLVHGIGSSAASYGPLIALAAPAFQGVVAPSAPAHGMSPHHPCAEDPEALFAVWRDVLDALSAAEPVALLGTSLGGAVALRYALERPARVRALVLCSPAGPRMTPAQIEEVRARFSMRRLRDGERFLRILFDRPPPLAPLVGLAARAALRGAPVQALLAGLSPSVGLSRRELGALRVPALLFWGGRERVLPAGLLDIYREALPPALVTIVEPPHFGHSPQLEHPRELLAAALSWLDALPDPLPPPSPPPPAPPQETA